jgi:hypothetical protein
MKKIDEVKFIDYPNSPNERGYTAYPNDFNYVTDMGMTGTISEKVKAIIEKLDELFYPENSLEENIMEKTAPFRKRPDYEQAKHKYKQIRMGFGGGYGYGGYAPGGSEASEGTEDNDADDVNEMYEKLQKFAENYGVQYCNEEMGGATGGMAVADMGGSPGGMNRRMNESSKELIKPNTQVIENPKMPGFGYKGKLGRILTSTYENGYCSYLVQFGNRKQEYHGNEIIPYYPEDTIKEDMTTADVATYDTVAGSPNKGKHHGNAYKDAGYERLGDQEPVKEGYDHAKAEVEYEDKKELEKELEKEKEEKTKKLKDKTKPMTEKEKRIKALAESYGIVSKAKASIEEEDEEEESEDKDEKKGKGPKKGVNPFAKKGKEKDSEDDEDEEGSEEKKDKKPKKGVNPFAKKDKKSEEDSEEEEEDESDETHEFKGAGCVVKVTGVDREIAKSMAAKLLAPIGATSPVPVGEYTIKFESIEAIEDTAFEDTSEDVIPEGVDNHGLSEASTTSSYEAAGADWKDIAGLLTSFIEAFKKFGVKVYQSPYHKGSDSYGFLISKTPLSKQVIAQADKGKVKGIGYFSVDHSDIDEVADEFARALKQAGITLYIYQDPSTDGSDFYGYIISPTKLKAKELKEIADEMNGVGREESEFGDDENYNDEFD